MSSFPAFFLPFRVSNSMSQFVSLIYGFRQVSMSAKSNIASDDVRKKNSKDSKDYKEHFTRSVFGS